MRLYNPNIDIVNDNGYTNVLKILSKIQILTSIKGRNSVVNLRNNDALQTQRWSCNDNCLQNLVNVQSFSRF